MDEAWQQPHVRESAWPRGGCRTSAVECHCHGRGDDGVEERTVRCCRSQANVMVVMTEHSHCPASDVSRRCSGIAAHSARGVTLQCSALPNDNPKRRAALQPIVSLLAVRLAVASTAARHGSTPTVAVCLEFRSLLRHSCHATATAVSHHHDDAAAGRLELGASSTQPPLLRSTRLRLLVRSAAESMDGSVVTCACT